MLEHWPKLSPHKRLGEWCCFCFFICKFQLPGCLIFHTTNASAIVEIEVIVDKGSWLYVHLLYIYTVFRSLDLFFRWLFSFRPFTNSAMVNHYGITIRWIFVYPFSKGKHPANPLGYHHGASLFQEKLPRRWSVEHFRWRGIFFDDLPLSNLLSFRSFSIDIFIQPLPSRWSNAVRA